MLHKLADSLDSSGGAGLSSLAERFVCIAPRCIPFLFVCLICCSRGILPRAQSRFKLFFRKSSRCPVSPQRLQVYCSLLAVFFAGCCCFLRVSRRACRAASSCCTPTSAVANLVTGIGLWRHTAHLQGAGSHAPSSPLWPRTKKPLLSGSSGYRRLKRLRVCPSVVCEGFL